MDEDNPTRATHVVIVGGDIGGLEAALALHDLAAGRVRLTLVAPQDDFTFRPLEAAAPFCRGHVESMPLAAVMAECGGGFVRGAVMSVDTNRRTVNLTDGAHVSYDVLILAPGATREPAFAQALTLGVDMMALGGLLADIEEGWSHSVAFVVPSGCAWPLSLYETALMTAEDVASMNIDSARLHLVTREHSPMQIFGAEASAAVAGLLDDAGVVFHGGVAPRVTQKGRVEIGTDTHIDVDRIVALPRLSGPRFIGIPANPQGFIGVDQALRVHGLDRIYAIGDAIDRPVKQGGITCQQADIAAAHIARLAGVNVDVPIEDDVLRGRLLTGRRDRFLQHTRSTGRSASSVEPLWSSAAKVSGRYLTPYLAAKGIVVLPLHAHGDQDSMEVELPLTWDEKRRREDILGLAPLSPIANL